MASVNRFIQFNNETVDTQLLQRMELLAGALAEAPYLKVTTRKLMEFRPSESTISMSVFWKHRPETVERNGYLSDIYLMSGGFWRYFNLHEWRSFKRIDTHLPLLLEQLLLCAEEFRLSEQIIKERPGTKRAFEIRETVYTEYHTKQLEQNSQKGFSADAFLNAAYLRLRGRQDAGLEEWEPLFQIWTHVFDARTTADSADVIARMVGRLEFLFEKDTVQSYYTFGESPDKVPPFHYHEGVETENSDDEEKIETLEEWFHTWHREMEMEEAAALEFELEQGQSGMAEGGREEQGAEDVQQTAQGEGRGEHLADNEAADEHSDQAPKKAGSKYGAANDHVEYHESRIRVVKGHKTEIDAARSRHTPYVKALLKELRKRIDSRQSDARRNLNAGRLSKQLVPLAIEERPKPFYRKSAPSRELDAVFCLLIDGSASMIDKLDETRQAVLLFHDVLRGLNVPHEIVLFYEDAYEASESRQPNYFEWMHKFEDGTKDHAQEIWSMEDHEDNRDGFAIRWMKDRLRSRTEQHRFLLVFSDGEPSAYNYAENGVIDTAKAVEETKKQGIEVLHLFLSSEKITEEQAAFYRMMYGNKSVSANSLDQFVDQTLRLLKRTLHLVLQGG
ncbi:nitric oxide reductase activation protein NorD [Planococcus salinus]|uniref:VWA domain-containing protein n=1 Tax=Planococcus salinus TaxID=1848460 RepID=A0A3M8P9Q1_9BACL|nr:VWA domain-containing protein [Planococcus salinus]RNF40426.1 VWA domain-containing protein [Planococcus salinus]